MGTGPRCTGTGRDREQALRDWDRSGTDACGNGQECKCKTSPVQHTTTNGVKALKEDRVLYKHMVDISKSGNN